MLFGQRPCRRSLSWRLRLLRVEHLRRQPLRFCLRAERLRRNRPGGFGLRQALGLLQCLRRALEHGHRFDDLWQTLGLRLRLEHLRRALSLRLHESRRHRPGWLTLRAEHLRVGRALRFALRMEDLRR